MQLEEQDLAGMRSEAVLRIARSMLSEDGAVNISGLMEASKDESVRRALGELAVEQVPANGLSPEDCVRELKCVPLRARMAQIQRDLSQASGEALDDLLREKNLLSRRMATLAGG
jgi:hypothetical protein